jgi:hypothetical protein
MASHSRLASSRNSSGTPSELLFQQAEIPA